MWERPFSFSNQTVVFARHRSCEPIPSPKDFPNLLFSPPPFVFILFHSSFWTNYLLASHLFEKIYRNAPNPPKLERDSFLLSKKTPWSKNSSLFPDSNSSQRGIWLSFRALPTSLLSWQLVSLFSSPPLFRSSSASTWGAIESGWHLIVSKGNALFLSAKRVSVGWPYFS